MIKVFDKWREKYAEDNSCFSQLLLNRFDLSSDLSDGDGSINQVDEVLRQSLSTIDFLNGLFEKAPNGLVILDDTLRVIGANQYARNKLFYHNLKNHRKNHHKPFTTFLISGISDFLNWIYGQSDRYIDVKLFDPNKKTFTRIFRKKIEHEGQVFYLLNFYSNPEDKRQEQSYYLFKIVFDSLREGLFIADNQFNIIHVNQAFTEITGFVHSDVVGKPFGQLLGKQTSDGFVEETLDDLLEKGYWKGIVYNQKKSGENYPEELEISAFFSDNQEPEYYVGTFDDISERVRRDKDLQAAAETDALTQLYNRMGFNNHMSVQFERAQRLGDSFSVMFLDLDKFKSLNDSYGHKYGDELLISLSKRLKGQLRASDFIARLGGDEFVVALGGEYEVRELEAIAQNLLNKLKHPYKILDITYEITLSVGIASYPSDALSFDGLVKAADVAMYQAKGAGRNRVVVFDPRKHKFQSEQQHFKSRITQAIIDREFQLYYQPQHDITTGDLIGFEGLARWVTQDQVILPGEWLSHIDQDKISISLGNHLLSQVFQNVASWQMSGFNWPVSVNVSALQLKSVEFIKHLEHLLDYYNDISHLIKIELLETAFIESDPVIIENVERIEKLGFKLILDDFGTGHSSIYSLTKFNFEKIKIDQHFIASISSENKDNIVLEGIINLLESMELDFICEGVETQSQVDYLRSKRCRLVQGFYFSQAIPAVEVQKYLRPFDSALIEKPH